MRCAIPSEKCVKCTDKLEILHYICADFDDTISVTGILPVNQKEKGGNGDEVAQISAWIAASVYLPTEENENEQVVMNDQPESSYWFPEQLLEWNPQEDPDLAYNVSTVPLAQRADTESLRTVNSTQNRETKVMAISIMNASTSGNAPRG